MNVSRPVSKFQRVSRLLQALADWLTYCVFHLIVGIQKKRFVIPQESKEYDEYYCNDSAYSSMNILYVTGVIRLEYPPAATSAAVATKTSKKTKFDVWPTYRQKRESRRKCNQHWSSMGLGNYFADY